MSKISQDSAVRIKEAANEFLNNFVDSLNQLSTQSKKIDNLNSKERGYAMHQVYLLMLSNFLFAVADNKESLMELVDLTCEQLKSLIELSQEEVFKEKID